MASVTTFSSRVLLIGAGLAALGGIAAAQTTPTAAQAARYWKPVEDALGRKGTPNPGGVLKFSFPRSDLRVVLSGVILKPALALGTWVAFKRIGDHVMVMGDLVLLDSEVASVMGSLQQNGVEQTALHNHLLRESPHVMYMHIRAIGNAVRIAKAVRTALEFTQTPLAPAPTPPAAATAAPTALDLDTASIAKVMGVRGKVNGGVYQLTFPRLEKIRQEKMDIPPSMGIATAINFQSTGAGKAAVTGDFVLLGREVNPVIWALGENGIEVTAIHSHMIGEEPRLFFMHFWANDDVGKLARGLKAALDRTRARR
jgi:hypothetical protein